MKLSKVLKLVVSLLVAELAGLIGSIFTVAAVSTWYPTLVKPVLNPPSWVFAPVWNLLFVLMGLAAWIIWKRGAEKREVRVALSFFIIQLILNSLWSFIFFGLHNPAFAFIELIILWLAILATIISFAKVSRRAAYLLIPYILWVSFAGYLNYSIWRLNPATSSNPNIACTTEAKLCPDGTSVGRSGPSCEFAACPTATSSPDIITPAGWSFFNDPILKVSYYYPAIFPTTYTTTVNWPPQVSLGNGTFTCNETNPALSVSGRVSEIKIKNQIYCLTALSEGAAGSVYTDYTYTTEKSGKLVTLKFTLRAVQCLNYDNPQQSACLNERESFNLDELVNQIVETMSIK